MISEQSQWNQDLKKYFPFDLAIYVWSIFSIKF